MSHGGKLTISLEAIEDNKVNILVSDTGQRHVSYSIKTNIYAFLYHAIRRYWARTAFCH